MANIMSLSAAELRLQGLFLVIVWFCLAFRCDSDAAVDRELVESGR